VGKGDTETNKKRVLVVGGGGREHALIWKLAQSPLIGKIFCAPGNAGTALLAENVFIHEMALDDLQNLAHERDVDLTVVGPEAPLMAGIVDRFQAAGLPIFGPTQHAARLEGSKVFAKQFMTRHDIPTAPYVICHSAEETRAVTSGKSFPYVIKVDGLAAGKGALIIKNRSALDEAMALIWDKKTFGTAGESVVVEDFLCGEELSVLAITDGEEYVMLTPAQDHKRVFDDDRGPNTGGMGAYAPVPVATTTLLDKVAKRIIEPVLAGMQAERHPYRGVLYCGLMVEDDEPAVVEFNARFGDPETQALMPLLDSDLLVLLESVARGRLDTKDFKLQNACSACIIMASAGYPASYRTGYPIYGLDESWRGADWVVFQAGTKREEGQLKTSGGRVLGVTAWAGDLQNALQKAYDRIRKINFEGMHYRTDIGKRGLRHHFEGARLIQDGGSS